MEPLTLFYYIAQKGKIFCKIDSITRAKYICWSAISKSSLYGNLEFAGSIAHKSSGIVSFGKSKGPDDNSRGPFR
jgi:hypothetical protein